MDCLEPLEGRPAVRLFENRRRAGTDPTADACTRTPPERHPNAARMSPERLLNASILVRLPAGRPAASDICPGEAEKPRNKPAEAKLAEAMPAEAMPVKQRLRNTPRRSTPRRSTPRRSKTRRSKTRGTNPQKQPRGRRGRQRKIILISETFPLMRDAFFAKRKHPIELLYTFVLRGGVSPGE